VQRGGKSDLSTCQDLNSRTYCWLCNNFRLAVFTLGIGKAFIKVSRILLITHFVGKVFKRSGQCNEYIR
jgi:hypothetical protein